MTDVSKLLLNGDMRTRFACAEFRSLASFCEYARRALRKRRRAWARPHQASPSICRFGPTHGARADQSSFVLDEPHGAKPGGRSGGRFCSRSGRQTSQADLPMSDRIRRVRVLAEAPRNNGDHCGEGARENKRTTSAGRDGAQAHIPAGGRKSPRRPSRFQASRRERASIRTDRQHLFRYA